MRTGIFLFLFRSLLYVKCPADSKYSRYVFLNEGNTPFNTLERKAGKDSYPASYPDWVLWCPLKTGLTLHSRRQVGTQRRGEETIGRIFEKQMSDLAHLQESNLLLVLAI